MPFTARGELGVIWRLDTERGSWAVKELLAPDQETGDDIGFQMAAVQAGIPMPKPVLSNSGSPIAVLPEGTHVRVYEWVDIDPLRRCPPETAGELLHRMHALRYEPGEMHPWYREALGAHSWSRLRAALSDRPEEWAHRLLDLLPDLERAELKLRRPGGDPAELIRCHLDLNPDNVAITTAGRPVVLDWENASAADPRQEAAMAAVDFMAMGPAGLGVAPAVEFIQGYRGAGGVFQPTGPEVFALALGVQAHLLELHVGRIGTPETPDETRLRSAAALVEMSTAPLTSELVARLLAAWR